MRGLTRKYSVESERDLSPLSSYVQITHAKVLGRTRLHIRGLTQSPAFGAFVTHCIERERGVKVVSLSTVTATVLVEHPRDMTPEIIRSDLDVGIAHYCRSKAHGGASLSLVSTKEEAFTSGDDWFRKNPEEIAAKFSVSLHTGLDATQVQTRLEEWGPNAQPIVQQKSPWTLLWLQYRNLPSGLLGASVFISLMTGARLDAVLISGVLITNGLIGYFTEKKTGQLISALGAYRRSLVPTLRMGTLSMVLPDELVPGDIVILEPGPVPADIRIIECERLYADESTLTGESTPIAKRAEILNKPSLPLGERANLLFTGTVILSGHGRGVVVATGRLTELGRIQNLVANLVTPTTPLQEHIAQVGDLLVHTSLAACVSLFFLGLARGLSALEMLKTVISLAIAAVPEGLPTVGTTTMALGIANMQKKDVFVRHLAAVENLGAVSVICFDKTGTITLNQMSVTDIVTPSADYEVEDGTLLRNGSPIDLSIDTASASRSYPEEIHRLARVSVLCNDAELADDTDKSVQEQYPSSFGSPTEKALLRFAKILGISLPIIRRAYPRLRTRPRTETSMSMGTWHKAPRGTTYAAAKGSPEEILAQCDRYLADGEVRPLTATARSTFLADNQRLASKALRVLALAEETEDFSLDEDKSLSPEPLNRATSGMIWLGLIGLKDPPRAGVGPLLDAFHAAGILTNMITGDQESTAQAIGRDLGMNGAGAPARLPIFSRVSPSDKLKIIQSLQSQGAVVAMTGDGVNDSPALRAADVGIAMGQGAGAAIDAAEVVLAKGNLETLLEAVKLGRTIRANLGKAIHFLIATNLSELLVTFAGVLLGQSHLLGPRQLLWINLLTDVFPAIGLAFEPPESHVMDHPPLGREAELFEDGEWRTMGLEALFMTMGSITSYGIGLKLHRDHGEASTMAFFSLTVAQLLHATAEQEKDHTIFSSEVREHDHHNPWLSRAVNWGLTAQVASIVIPSLRSVLGNTRLTASGWTAAIICGGCPFIMTQALQSISTEIIVTQAKP